MNVSSQSPKIYDELSCAICLEEYEKNQSTPCLLLTCGHLFHQACSEKWVKRHRNCPICRSPSALVLTPNEEQWVVTEKTKKIVETLGLSLMKVSGLGITAGLLLDGTFSEKEENSIIFNPFFFLPIAGTFGIGWTLNAFAPMLTVRPLAEITARVIHYKP